MVISVSGFLFGLVVAYLIATHVTRWSRFNVG